MNGIGAGGGSPSNGNNRESNSSLYYASNQNGNETGGYPIHENFGLPQEPEFSQANHGMFYHDPRTGVAANSPACVGGDYNGGITAPSYMIQQPSAAQYLASFQRRHPPSNVYHEPPAAGGSHCLGNNQTILAAARELCGSPFDDDPRNIFDQEPEQPQNNYFQEESPTVHDPRATPTTTTSTTCLVSPVKCAPVSIVSEEEPRKPAEDQDEVDELDTFKLSIPSLSLTPLTGKEVVDRVSDKAEEVVTRYLPCVELLVACQQDLRAGLIQKSSRRGVGTSQLFYRNLLEPLPDRFFRQNQRKMPRDELRAACDGIQSLLGEAKKVERTGCEGMKNAFLGGMRDGESWGLRRWLSKNGGALQTCNDLELILGSMRQLPKATVTTKLLAKKIGPKAKIAYDKLKDEVPNAYQEVSSAHPYLPFFHRLESALKGLHEFDPDDDGVICLDDDSSDEDTVLEVGNCSSNTTGVYASNPPSWTGGAKKDLNTDVASCGVDRPRYEKSGSESPILFQQLVDEARKPSFDDDSDIEIVFVKNSTQNDLATNLFTDSAVFDTSSVTDKYSIDEQLEKGGGKPSPSYEPRIYGHSFSIPEKQRSILTTGVAVATAVELVGNIEQIVQALETGQDIRPQSAQGCRDFWSNPTCNFIIVLRLFQKLINDTASHSFLDPANRQEYDNLIKNPLCFRDIVAALCNDDACESYAVNGARIVRKTGVLGCSGLKKWNMFEGSKLIQAVDLVLLNNLAVMGKSTNLHRKNVMRLRKSFWEQIRNCSLGDKNNIPTKRKETSGFVIRLK